MDRSGLTCTDVECMSNESKPLLQIISGKLIFTSGQLMLGEGDREWWNATYLLFII